MAARVFFIVKPPNYQDKVYLYYKSSPPVMQHWFSGINAPPPHHKEEHFSFTWLKLFFAIKLAPQLAQ